MKALSLFQRASFYAPFGYCLLFGLWLCAVAANAQTNDVPIKSATTIGAEQNPFDFVLQTVEGQEQLKRQSKGFQQTVQGKAIRGKSQALQYRKKFGGTLEQAQALQKILVAKYGEPNSIRGQSHVWDIKNPNIRNGQADIVTIILIMGEAGGYELVMDRDKGGDGRATWAAPRIEPVIPKQEKQSKTRILPVLQPDND